MHFNLCRCPTFRWLCTSHGFCCYFHKYLLIQFFLCTQCNLMWSAVEWHLVRAGWQSIKCVLDLVNGGLGNLQAKSNEMRRTEKKWVKSEMKAKQKRCGSEAKSKRSKMNKWKSETQVMKKWNKSENNLNCKWVKRSRSETKVHERNVKQNRNKSEAGWQSMFNIWEMNKKRNVGETKAKINLSFFKYLEKTF